MTRIVLLAIATFMLANPTASPAAAQVDPVARALTKQALATAPTTAKTTIVGGEQPDTPPVSGTIGNAPIQVNRSAVNDTGIASSQVSRQYPLRYDTMNLVVTNSSQQTFFPGDVPPARRAAGSTFGGWGVIGAGAALPGCGALAFSRAGAARLATPETGRFEVDANARRYCTTTNHVRRSVMLADITDRSVTVLPGDRYAITFNAPGA